MRHLSHKFFCFSLLLLLLIILILHSYIVKLIAFNSTGSPSFLFFMVSMVYMIKKKKKKKFNRYQSNASITLKRSRQTVTVFGFCRRIIVSFWVPILFNNQLTSQDVQWLIAWKISNNFSDSFLFYLKKILYYKFSHICLIYLLV